MPTKHHKHLQHTQNGFVLLLTLVVVSIILAIGLSMLNITMKQLTLSNLARESEIALHAASSGIECMQFHRVDPRTRQILLNEDSDPDTTEPLLSCAGTTPINSSTNHDLNLTTNGLLYNYLYDYDVDGDKCVETSMYLIDLRNETSDVTRTVNEGLDEISCDGGSVCTTIFSRGFNRACADIDGPFTVQRELTIEF